MKANLKGMSEKELIKLRNDIDKALDKLASAKRDEALKAAAAAAKKFGYNLGELVGDEAPKQKRGGKKKSAPAKFKNPEDPSQTWTGRGRQPAWYKAAIEAGKSPQDLAV